ncbi:transposase [Solwaraspora sp. WMMA2065]|uniref:transposase n=1 Tax=Solwaraspora sp. WMMA2065 TaxID=3015166 RepID=UPI00259BB6A7|nr:transposase [Solwaraspora sp. WMMA2065]WJK33726.1 transposase [Solwaraspora sp. WMMA2065]
MSEDLSREELISLARTQDARIAEQDAQIAELTAAYEALAVRLARVEHLLSRNSSNSSSPPSKDDDPGRTPPAARKKRDTPAGTRGRQRGAPGSNLAWSDAPDQRRDRFPEGSCGCGAELVDARDLGVVDRYQQVEVPLMTATLTQYDQHAVRCGCGKLHTAARPEGAGAGPVGYGPNLQAWAVYLMVVHFIPVQRCVQMLRSLTGATPSPGFVHGVLTRVAALTSEVDKRIRMLITLAYAVCCDETPLRVGPKKPRPGRKKAEKYLLVACTELWTHYQVGDRDLATFTAFVVKDLTGSVVVHDRYRNYDSAELGTLVHQLCWIHLLRSSFRYAARQDWEKIAKALKPVYTAPTEDAATERFLEFAEAWGRKYPAIVKLWENAWAEFVPFLGFDVEIRKVICSTNAIESVNARIRKAVRARGHFPNEQAALKCVYMALMSLDPTGNGRRRWTMRWKAPLNAFQIAFEGRLTPANL